MSFFMENKAGELKKKQKNLRYLYFEKNKKMYIKKRTRRDLNPRPQD